MFHTPHPDLNEEERAMLGSAPEACLRHAIQRGALSLELITEHLTPRAAAVVRGIVGEERSPTPAPPSARTENAEEAGPGRFPALGAALYSMGTGEREPESLGEKESWPSESRSREHQGREGVDNASSLAEYQSLFVWPGLQRAVDEGILTADEALRVANTIDGTLGRYLTGTLYAAP